MPNLFVPTAEAAFIAGITDRDMNRAVDEHILPDSMIRLDKGRRFARLGAALAGFYFGSDDVYAPALRRRVVLEVAEKLRRHRDREVILALGPDAARIDWHVDVPSESVGAVRVDVGGFVEKAMNRTRTLERAEELVTSDQEILGGLPVFAGTRVPVDSVLGSLRKGIDRKRIFDAYPSLTDEHLEAARIYVDVRPRRGRPSKSTSVPASWKLKSRRAVQRVPRA